MVSILLGVWNGGGVCCCCPAQCSGVAHALLIPLQCWLVLLSCVHCSLPGVWCGVGECVSAVFVWWGIFCPLPPLCGGGRGHRGWWAAWRVKGGGVAGLPVECWCPPSACWRPPCRLPCGPIEWRWGVRAVLSRVWIGSGTLHCLTPSRIV